MRQSSQGANFIKQLTKSKTSINIAPPPLWKLRIVLLLGVVMIAAGTVRLIIPSSSGVPSALDLIGLPVLLIVWLQFLLFVASIVCLTIATLQVANSVNRGKLLPVGTIGTLFFTATAIGLILAGSFTISSNPFLTPWDLLTVLVPRPLDPVWLVTMLITLIINYSCIRPFKQYRTGRF